MLLLFISLKSEAQEVQIKPTLTINSEFYDNPQSISTDTTAMLIEQCQLILDKYSSIADFIDLSSGTVSSDKSVAWSGLFTTGARVINDISLKPEMIHHADYADNVYEYLFEDGVSFRINDLILEELGYNASGFLYARITMEKLVNTYYEGSIARYNSKGRKINLRFDLEFPPNDLTYGKITQILSLGGIKEDVDRYSVLSLSIGGGVGKLNLESNLQANNLLFNDPKVNSVNYGAELLYRYGIGKSKRLFIALALGVDVINFNTNELSFRGILKSQDPINYGILDGSNEIDTLNNVSIDNLKYPVTNTSNRNFEILSMIRIKPGIGVSYKLLDKSNHNFYIDALFMINYASVISGARRINSSDVYLIPNSSNFPSYDELGKNVDEFEYYFNPVEGSTNAELKSNFSYGLAITPYYQFDINIVWGIQIGLEYYLGLSDFFQHSQDGTITDGELFDKGFSSSKLNTVNLKIGAYYEFGKGR